MSRRTDFRRFLTERAASLRREAVELERIIALLDDFEFPDGSPRGPYPVRSRATQGDEVFDAICHYLEEMPDNGFPVRTGDVAEALRWAGLHISLGSLKAATSAALARLEDEGKIIKVGHGLWERV